jgi:hypothetical protein
MAEARERSAWGRTSALLALIANAHRDARKTRPFKPSDFDPFARRGSGGESATNDIPGLRALFQGRQISRDTSHEADRQMENQD